MARTGEKGSGRRCWCCARAGGLYLVRSLTVPLFRPLNNCFSLRLQPIGRHPVPFSSQSCKSCLRCLSVNANQYVVCFTNTEYIQYLVVVSMTALLSFSGAIHLHLTHAHAPARTKTSLQLANQSESHLRTVTEFGHTKIRFGYPS